jgi:hypothetical protein
MPWTGWGRARFLAPIWRLLATDGQPPAADREPSDPVPQDERLRPRTEFLWRN